MFTKLASALVVSMVMACSTLWSTVAHAAFPDRPITLIVPWAAGGGTDAVARMIGALLEKEFKVPVSVVNRTGGNGVVGHSAIATASPDGYTIGMITIEINMMHWMKLTELTYASYTPLALMNADPAGLQVRADAPYKNANELIAAIKANPGKLKASGTGVGGGWHLALAGMLRSFDIDPKTVPWVASTGAATALVDLAAGGIDIVPSSIPEATALIVGRAGQESGGDVGHAQRGRARCAHVEGSHRLELDDGAVARHRRTQGHAAGSRGEVSRRAEAGLRQQGVPGLHEGAWLHAGLGRCRCL